MRGQPPQIMESVKDAHAVHAVYKLNILDFNCKNILTCGPFFKEIEKNVDICLLQEHWLYSCQLKLLDEIHENFTGAGKAIDSNDPIAPVQIPRGYGGTAILWKKKLNLIVTPLDIGSERIQAIEIKGIPNMIILSVYMPCKGSSNHIAEFGECIDQLHEIYNTYENTHQIIIGGDFNEDILNGLSSQRKSYVQELMNEHCLGSKDNGPTFIHVNGRDTSTIDFILYQEKYADSIVEIKKLDVIANVSDHYPLKIVIKHQYAENIPPKKNESKQSGNIKWDKVDTNLYAKQIASEIEKVRTNVVTKEEIDKSFQKLNEILTTTANEVAPKVRIGKRKPKLQVMNEQIKQAISNKKTAYYNWKMQGRPDDPNNAYLIEKKLSTHNLRKECRLEVALRRMNQKTRMIEARTSDRKTFYNIIRRQRGKLAQHIDHLNIGDDIFRNNDIVEGWHRHFSKLAEKKLNINADVKSLQQVEREVIEIKKMCQESYKHSPITKDEIEKTVQSLNRNKATDYFGVSAEHFIYGGNELLEYLRQLLNTSFEHCYIPDEMKIGSLFPVFKNKGERSDVRNYRGITVNPTISKIIEKIIKLRENDKILGTQNPLQRGFTENTSPLIAELIIEEFERENKDLKKPTYIALLDAKSAFDVVVHDNLIRRLFQIGISHQSILILQNLYQGATSCVKWNGKYSDPFKIDQGVRQGGALSADLYKVYINPLLNLLCESGMGGKIGNINCCAPTCADDIAIIANNPLEIQSMVDISVDFSRREGYILQPTKSVILPVKTTAKHIEIDNQFWTLDEKPMPVVSNSTHIGIHKSDRNSAQLTVEENIKKARRTVYSLMGAGLHGKGGLDPETAISIFRSYVLPVLTYGLEIVLPSGKTLTMLQQYYKKLLKQILSMAMNVADPAIYILSGMMPIEAEIHLKALNLYGNITRADKNTTEWRVAERQLQIKSSRSHSWFTDIQKICCKYQINNVYRYLHSPLTKSQWKSKIEKTVKNYWIDTVNSNASSYKSLKYVNRIDKFGKVHRLLKTVSASSRDISRIPVRIKIATGTYIFQTKRAVFNKYAVDPTCKLCNEEDETFEHFLLDCTALHISRKQLLVDITNRCNKLIALLNVNDNLDIARIVANPYQLLDFACKRHFENIDELIGTSIEPACRALLYTLHMKRYETLGINQCCIKRTNSNR